MPAPYTEGFVAGCEGRPLGANPYPAADARHRPWALGWTDGWADATMDTPPVASAAEGAPPVTSETLP